MIRTPPLDPTQRPLRRRAFAFVSAWLVASAWGCIVQTQFNLAVLTRMSVDVPLPLRLLTSAQDLATFGGIYAGIVLAAWLPAFAVAAWLARRRPALRLPLFAAAAGVGLAVAIRTVDFFAPMPVFIDATRTVAGLLAMVSGSALAGALFARWTSANARTPSL